MAKKRNNFIELMRFLFSILVVGYHVQKSMNEHTNQPRGIFINGALAVEFFFLLSGYFMAMSLEKMAKIENVSIWKKWFNFMKGKIKGLIFPHLIANVLMVIILSVCYLDELGERMLDGILGLFLLQIAPLWTNLYEKALIVPEWYISAMLLNMLFMVPIFLGFKSLLKNRETPIVWILLGVLIIIMIIYGAITGFVFKQNFIYFLRGWAELCVGMFSYYITQWMKTREYNNWLTGLLELIAYAVPLIIGILSVNNMIQYISMGITVIFIFFGLQITFSGKGILVEKDILNKIYGILGEISLNIYLFHPPLVDLFKKYITRNFFARFFIVFPISVILALLYKFIWDCITSKDDEKKEKQNNISIKDKENENENKRKEENENSNNNIHLQKGSE
jgi:peptidoglycan/LPS O-acetylase OafA/YrhL